MTATPRTITVTLDVSDWGDRPRSAEEVAEAIFEHLHATAETHEMCPLDDCFADLSIDGFDFKGDE